MKTAICYLSCDKPELVRQSLPVLVAGAQDHHYHLFIADGSVTQAGQDAVWNEGFPTATTHSNIRGGAGAAIVYALTWMLQHKEHYDVIGIVETDVLLSGDWFARCMALFQRGLDDGLEVGAVSARCYQDRVLFQRDGYAVCHNLGAGMVLFTRAAARLVLDQFRTAWSSDNRRVFAQLCGVDIGTYWAFRTNEHYLTADWHWEVCLAVRGLASVALTPSPCEMIGQDPPLAEQGLTIVNEQAPKVTLAVEAAQIDNGAFERYRDSLQAIRDGKLSLGVETQFHFDPNTSTWTYFPHQMHMLGGEYHGDWRLRETRGWGTFAWTAGPQERVAVDDEFFTPMPGQLLVPIFGPCAVLVSGGKDGGQVEIIDVSGFKADPLLAPEGPHSQVLQIQVPGAVNYRNIKITALTPGVTFWGIQTRDRQPSLPNATFDHSMLPPP